MSRLVVDDQDPGIQHVGFAQHGVFSSAVALWPLAWVR
jgi:hypothetical protein